MSRRQGRWQWTWWLSVAAIAGAITPALASDVAIDPARLANLVRQDCGSCHGLTLRGGLGKPLTREHLRQWDRAELVHIILDGVPGTPMPPWRPILTEAEARWIADMLKRGSLQ